ncbi:MAG: putative signaling protein [Acidimicrobiales bacterium]|nr:putative signaling protein [Acidimicrobiales bacterium]
MGRRGHRRGRRGIAPVQQPYTSRIAVEPSSSDESYRRLYEAAQRSEQRLTALLQHASDIISVLDADARVVYSSPAGQRLLGYEPGFWSGHSVFELIHPDDAPHVSEVFLRQMGNPGLTETVEFRLRHADGRWRHMEAIANNLLDDPTVNGVIVTTRDVTDRKRAEEELLLLQTIVLAVNDAPDLRIALQVAVQRLCEATSWVCGAAWTPLADGTALELRESWSIDDPRLVAFRERRKTLQLAPGVGLPGRVWASGESTLSAEVPAEEDDAREAGLAVGVAVPVVADGEVVAVLELFNVTAGADDLRVMGVVTAVASQLGSVVERKRAQERLAHQALHDPLTELPNRALFLDRLALAQARLRRRPASLAVLFADVDRFKLVNDSLGHDAGDRLLVLLARRLRDVLRPGDTLARFGGDEFAVLCEDVGTEEVAGIAGRIMDALVEPFAVGADEVLVSMSVGIALSDDADARPQSLLRDADAAMYLAKDRGRARVEVFDEAMRDESTERLVMENALRRAPERGELRALYQPIIRLSDGAMIAAEALVRWDHPERGLLDASQFVPLAEETGIIVSIGSWMLEEACASAATWVGNGTTPAVSVNLSARELGRPDVVETVAAALEHSGLDPDRLWLEITESTLMDDADTAVAALERLRALGVHLSVDDFGTGYSSLAYLRRFPVDSLKVDRSFVAGLTEDPADSAIVEAVVSMAHSLRLFVVAEGVETDAQLARLRDLGCELAQGFLFAAPVPPAALEPLSAGSRW